MRIARGISIANVNKPLSGAVVYDADALAYFNANTAITSTANKTAINNFYLGLKSNGIYTKIKAMYLPIWGSASSSKWNLVNPVDTNAAFRLTFSTGWSFTTGGMQGSSSYANTYLAPQSNFTNANISLSTYSRTQIIQNSSYRVEIGCYDGTNFEAMSQQYDNFGKFFTAGTSNAASQLIVPGSISSAVTTGLQIGNRLSNVMKVFQNGTQLATKTVTTSALSSVNLYIGAYNNINSGVNDYSNRQLSFISIADGLTDTEANNLYTTVNTLMTYFGINV